MASKLPAIKYQPEDKGVSLVESIGSTPVLEEGQVLLPLKWFAQYGRPAALYRVMGELLDEDQALDFDLLPSLNDLEVEILNNPEALSLNASQTPEGRWGNALLPLRDYEGEGEVISTYSAYCRLLDLGWSEENAAVRLTSRLFFHILSSAYNSVEGDENSDDLDPERLSSNTSYRELAREAAAAALAQAGYDTDPRLLGYAAKLIKKVDRFIQRVFGMDESKPNYEQWVKIGSSHVLPADAAPPSVYMLQMLAHMPGIHTQYRAEMRRLIKYLARKPHQHIIDGAAPLQLLGKDIIEQPHLVTGDPLQVHYNMDGGLAERYELFWLEVLAKLGFLSQNPAWVKRYQRVIDACDPIDGVWNGEYRVVESLKLPPGWVMDCLRVLDGVECEVDLNLRIALVGRYLGRELEVC